MGKALVSLPLFPAAFLCLRVDSMRPHVANKGREQNPVPGHNPSRLR